MFLKGAERTNLCGAVTSVCNITVPCFHLAALNWPSLAFRVSVAWLHFIWIALVFLLPAFLLGWLVGHLSAERLETSRNLHFQNQLAERTRIARDLNDTLLQTIEASKMIADDALDPPTDPAQLRRTMKRLSDWLGQATREGQKALDSLRPLTSEESSVTSSRLSLWMRKLSTRLLPSTRKRH